VTECVNDDEVVSSCAVAESVNDNDDLHKELARMRKALEVELQLSRSLKQELELERRRNSAIDGAAGAAAMSAAIDEATAATKEEDTPGETR